MGNQNSNQEFIDLCRKYADECTKNANSCKNEGLDQCVEKHI
jgi:hypothetical protein